MRRSIRLVGLLLLGLLILTAFQPAGAAAQGPRYPVIFLPGIAGSELFDGTELVWYNTRKAVRAHVPVLGMFTRPWLRVLQLGEDGATPASPRYDIRVGTVLRRGITGVYAGFLGAMETYGYREGLNLFVYPYDWRRGIPHASRGLDTIIDEALRHNPRSDKVVLVGHSMGGLVARDYVVRTAGKRVAGTIAVGTPWFGTAVAWKALERGHHLGLRVPGATVEFRVNPDLQMLVQNFPSVYQLLPGQHYHDVYGGFVFRKGSPIPYWQAIGEEIRPRNAKLATGAGYGDRLMTGKHYGVLQYLVAGYGTETMYAADNGPRVWRERHGDGDEMVPLASADLGANYDARRPRRFLGPVQAVTYVKASHVWLMGQPRVQRQIRTWLGEIERGVPPRWGNAVRNWYR